MHLLSHIIYSCKTLYMFRTVIPSIIRSSKLRIQQRYVSNSCCLLLLGIRWNCSSISSPFIMTVCNISINEESVIVVNYNNDQSQRLLSLRIFLGTDSCLPMSVRSIVTEGRTARGGRFTSCPFAYCNMKMCGMWRWWIFTHSEPRQHMELEAVHIEQEWKWVDWWFKILEAEKSLSV
jgi:hypothetical protein